MKRSPQIVDEISLILNSLRQKAAGSFIVAEHLPSRPFARIAVEGEDVLLLFPAVQSVRQKSIRRAHFGVDFQLTCTVTSEFGQSTEELLVIRLTGPSKRLTEIFCEVVALLLRRMKKYDPSEVREFVRDLVDLFSSVDSPSEATVIGLWGELFTIINAQDPDVVGASWHSTPQDRFDFSLGDQRVEVKSTRGPRRHHFSLDQLRSTGAVLILVESVILVDSLSGFSIMDLIEMVGERISKTSVMDQVRGTALRILGAAKDDLDVRFEIAATELNRRFYRAIDIPQPLSPPHGVSEVRFVSDLQLVIPENPARLKKLGGLVSAMI